MPLPEPLLAIATEILEHFEDPTSHAPYALYVYEPDQELLVRRELQEGLRAYLTAKGVNVAAISLARTLLASS